MLRALAITAVWVVALVLARLSLGFSAWWWLLAVPVAAVAALGTWDLLQTRHTILRPTRRSDTSDSWPRHYAPRSAILHRVEYRGHPVRSRNPCSSSRRCADCPAVSRSGSSCALGHRGRNWFGPKGIRGTRRYSADRGADAGAQRPGRDWAAEPRTSGKAASGVDIVSRICQGPDFTMSAPAMMLAVGCIQALKCRTYAEI